MKPIHKWISVIILSFAVLFTGCNDDDSLTGGMDELESATFSLPLMRCSFWIVMKKPIAESMHEI